MRILKHILSLLVWSLLVIYLVVAIGVNTPWGQKYMGRRVAGLLSRTLGTSVTIDRVEYGFFSHVTLHDVLIKDQQGVEMLKANRLSTRIELLPLAEGKVSVATAQLFGVHAKLYQADADSKPNFQFVIDSLASKDTTDTSPLNLRVNSLIIRRSSVTYDRLDAEETPGQLNPHHLALSEISTHIILKEFSPDSLYMTVKRLSLREKSGLLVERLSLHYDGGRNASRLTDFQLRMPGTQLSLSDILVTYTLKDNRLELPSLRYSGSILPSRVTLSDVSCLLPSLQTFQSTLSCAASFKGKGDDLEIPALMVGSNTGDVNINLKGEVRGLTQQEPSWQTNIENLALSAKTINFISENLKGRRVEVPQELVRLGSIHLTGVASGQGVSDVQTRGQLKTDAGNVALAFSMNPQRQFKGSIDTKGFNLRKVLADDRFGQLATTIDVSGVLPAGSQPTIKADGTIQTLTYNGHDYDQILVNGIYSPTDIHGHVSVDDDHLRGDLLVNLKGHDPNDFEGTLDLRLPYLKLKNDDSYSLELLHMESGYDEQGLHYATMKSDFAEARITGHFDYPTLAQSFTNFIAAKLPTLPGLPAVNPHTKNNFALKATVHKSDWMQKLLGIDLRLSNPITLEGHVNDRQQELMVVCDAPKFYFNDSEYDNFHLTVMSPLNTLLMEMTGTKRMDDGTHMNLIASCSAYDNQLTTTLIWDDHAIEQMSGKITAQTSFNTALDGTQQALIRIVPSLMTVKGADWEVKPSSIVYSKKHLDIKHFAIEHDQQFLTLNGVASESVLDSVEVKMRDVDIEYVLDLVNFHAVDFSGKATGGGTLRGIFGNFEADGHLLVNQFEFEHGRMGTLDANVKWNNEKEQIDIHAVSDDGKDAMTYIDGYVSPKRNYIDLGIKADGTHIDFARSFMDSFISHIEGHANGQLRLAGDLDALNLTGGLLINGAAHVSTLGCTYALRNDSILLIPNEIEMVHFPIYDIYGTEAKLSGGIHHKELTDLTFDIYADAKNLLAYDFKDFNGDTFYGTVFATGKVGIHGRDEGVTIEAEVTPEEKSSFTYNAASPDAINSQEFIEWGSPDGKNSKDSQNEQSIQNSLVSRSDLTLNLKINATPKAEVRLLMDAKTNDYITLRGNGELQTTYYNKGGFNMFGTYRVTEGTYGLTIQNIIRKHFTFREGGTIVFGGDPYDAALNLQAQYMVSGVSLSDLNVGRSFSNTVRVNCLMNISGQPRQPIIEFDFEMPNVNADEQQMVRSIINSEEELNQQVVYLLAVGRFYPQGVNNATNTENSPSKTSLAMNSLLSGTLSGQINSVLGQLVKSNKWNFGANISTGDEGWNNAEYEGIINGRLLNNRLVINGQFGYRDNATTTAHPTFIGDFDISYLLLPNGNIAFKVYNQTNDRYFTKSSLNTQGVGLMLKKDFDGIPDLFGIKKKKKKGPQ